MKYLPIGILFLTILIGCATPKQFTSYLDENRRYVSDKMYAPSESIEVQYDFKQKGSKVKRLERNCLPLLVYWQAKNVINYSLDSSYYQNAIYNGVYRGVKALKADYAIKKVSVSFKKITNKFQYYANDITYYFLVGAITSSERSDLPINKNEFINRAVVEIELENGELYSKEVECLFKLKLQNSSHTETRAKRSVETMLANYEVQMEDVAYRMVLRAKKMM